MKQARNMSGLAMMKAVEGCEYLIRKPSPI